MKLVVGPDYLREALEAMGCTEFTDAQDGATTGDLLADPESKVVIDLQIDSNAVCCEHCYKLVKQIQRRRVR